MHATLSADLKTLRAEQPLALTPRTLIVGKNGTGKSAITQALEYALTGSASDHMGRPVVKAQALLKQLAPPDRKLHAHLSLPDGSVYMNGEPGLDPEAVFPLRALKENLLGNADAARRWLLARMQVDADRVLAELAQAQAHVKQANADALALQQQVDMLGQTAQPVTDAERAALAQTTGFTRQELAELHAELTRIHGEASAAWVKAQAMPASAPDGVNIDVIRGAHALVTAFAAAAAEAVRYCALAPEGLAPTPTGGPALPAVTWAQLQSQWAMQAAGYAPMVGQVQAREAAIAEAQRLSELFEAKRAAYVQAAANARPDTTELAAKVDAWDRLVRLRQQLGERLQAGVLAAAQATTLQAQLNALLLTAADGFNARVSQFLGVRGARFELVLLDGEKTAFRWGLRRAESGRLDTALSGAEWVQVQLAMACALVPLGYTGPVFLLAEDRAWDAESLACAMAALRDAPEHFWIVLTSTVLPARPVDGWTVIGPDGGLRDVVVATLPGLRMLGTQAEDLAADTVGAHVGMTGGEVPELSSITAHYDALGADGQMADLAPELVQAWEDGRKNTQVIDLPVMGTAVAGYPSVDPEQVDPGYIEAPMPKKRGRPKGSTNKGSKNKGGPAPIPHPEPAPEPEPTPAPGPAPLPEPVPEPGPAPADDLVQLLTGFAHKLLQPLATPAPLPALAPLPELAPLPAFGGLESVPPLAPALELPPGLTPLPPQV